MALTDAQITDTRRFMGYPLSGTTQPINDKYDIVYMAFGMVTMALFTRLNNLSVSEESILINTYLVNLNALETAIVSSSANLDTDKAAVWTHNKNEVSDREKLFDSWRLRLCAFIGCPPGKGIGSSVNVAMVR